MKEHAKQDTSIIAAITGLILFLVLALFGRSVQAAGLLVPINGDKSMVSLTSHKVDVTINNGFAKTEVDQIFSNSSENDLEALYTFPLPKQASLSEISLWINGKEVIGEVLEKKKAREIYEEQKAKGNETALAEKDDYKTFDISVYPVAAKGDTRVRLVYYQPLSIDLNVGRYVYPLAEGGVDEERISFWSVDDKVSGDFSFNLQLKSAQSVKEVRLPGYMQEAVIEQVQGDTEHGNTSVYNATLRFPEGGSLDKDIIFYYRLDDAVPARVELIPYKDGINKEGTFMLAITPGASLQRITEGTDWTFVLDKSGSMSGAKIQTLADGVARVIGKLSLQDRFRIVAFNNSAEEITKGYVNATPENVQAGASRVKNIVPGGGTALYAGLAMGLESTENERTSAIVLVTDGAANVGPSQHRDFLSLVGAKDVRLFAFIIGNSSNTPLLKRLADASGGFSMAISSQDDIYGRILQAKNKVQYEALHDVEVKFSGGKVTSLTPPFPRSLYRGQQLVMFGKYRKAGPVQLSLAAKISGQEHEWSCDVLLPESDFENPEIERLWALSAIESAMDEVRLAGETESLREEIIQLGTEYSLVTDYTSMVVLNDQEAENAGLQRSNSSRVEKERKAQQQRQAAPAASRRVDRSSDGGMFKNTPSPGVGSGPVGPFLLVVIAGCGFVMRKRQIKKNQ